jgi:hypothetical protein
MTLFEMEGFLSGKCLPGDMLVNETNAQYLHRKLNAYEATVTNLTAQVQGLVSNQHLWKPEVCPVTLRPFFLWIESPGGEMVPTYGGPYDSYTIPVANKDGEFSCERFDHDEGAWVDDVCLNVRLIDDQLETLTDAALAEIRAQGVDAFAADLGNAYQQLRAGSPQSKALKAVVFRAASFSEQLRKEQGK